MISVTRLIVIADAMTRKGPIEGGDDVDATLSLHESSSWIRRSASN